MSIRRKIFKTSIILLAFLVIIILLGLFGKQPNDEKKTRLIQESIYSANLLIEEKLSSCTEAKLLDDHFLKQQLLEKDCKVFVFEQDSLVFWSSSIITPDIKLFQDSSGFTLLSNGWYLYKIKKYKTRSAIAVVDIKNEYPYTNEYLGSNFIGKESSRIIGDISFTKGKHNVLDPNGLFLFSVNYPKTGTLYPSFEKVISLLYVIFIMIFGWLLYLFHIGLLKDKSRHISFFFFVVNFLIIRVVLQIFKLPSFIYEFEVFKPYSYGLSQFLPSLGDLYVNIAIALLISGAVFVHYKRYTYPKLKRGKRELLIIVLVLMPIAWYFFSYSIIQSLVIDSNIELSLNDIFSFKFDTLMAILIICCLWSVFILYVHRLATIVLKIKLSYIFYLYFAILLSISLFISHLLHYSLIVTTIILVMLPLVLHLCKQYKQFSVTPWLTYIVFFSAATTIILQSSNQEKERDLRILHAQSLSIEQDPVIEYLFEQSKTDFYQDGVMSSVFIMDTLAEEELVDFMLSRYFSNNYYRDNYHIQVTLCNDFHDLEIEDDNTMNKTVVNCYSFFENMIKDYGKFTSSKDFYYIEENTPQESYLGVLELEPTSIGANRVFVEFISKYVPDQLGYPRLLSNEDEKQLKYLPEYSYAIYSGDNLVSNYGQTIYPVALSKFHQLTGESTQFFSSKFATSKFSHLLYKIDENRSLIISKKQGDLLAKFAPLSYLILFLSIFFVIGYLIFYFTPKTFSKFLYYKNRLQLIIGVIIFGSFLIIGVSSLLYVKKLNANKNYNILSEKTHSVLVEVEHKLSTLEGFNPEITGYVTGILLKFSNVFFTDINLFDLEGNLLASSYTQIFNEGIISPRMNPVAYSAIARDKGAFYIHREKIGELEFLSAYIPFRNVNNNVVAYLNLPYFAKENQLKTELSEFMQTYVNIYFILAALSIFFGLIISNYLIRPLKMVEDSMTKIQLGAENKKIEWPYPDEIGNLIDEYNKMIDVLEESAILLAKSEREGAWREMAKQVAHEIKNPLTPMKLSVQYLMRSYQESDENWGEQLKRISNTIVEQIDTLAEIATEFSDFARTPKSKFGRVSLNEAISNSVHLFSGTDHVNIHFIYDKHDDYYVLSDNNQLLRVFNNLIKNSKQAIEHKEGKIEIALFSDESNHIVTVKDNGRGIPDEQKSKIFNPSFTTKTSGAGLGLAIVKSIIESANGKISFVSSQGEGTIFRIVLPKYIEDSKKLGE